MVTSTTGATTVGIVTTTSSTRQLSDGNGANGGPGTLLGQTPLDEIGFYGATPVVQPTGPSQAFWTRGLSAGVITTYASTQSPSAVAANTTVESSFTVQTGTGAQMLPATGDLFYVNKPTAQAGLGYANVRVASSNTVAVNFGNWTSGSITPTATETYSLVALRGLPALTAVLSPTAVAAGTTVEQQFAVTGLPSMSLVQVSKPTSQTGLIISNVRAVSDNVIGITFTNLTAASITPTASETYTITFLFGLDAVNNDVWYGFNVGTVGAIGAGVVVSGGSTTLTGVLATDMVTGIFDPTAQAAATNAAYPVKAIPTANTMTLYFAGIGTGATPTASEVYGVRTSRLAPAAPLVLYRPTLTPVSVAANTTAEQVFTVTGLVAGSPVWINKTTSAQPGLGIVGVRVSAANTLAVTYANSTSSAIVPNAEQYIIGNFQVPSPSAGNSVYQSVSPVVNNLSTLGYSLRTALVNEGLIAGA